MQMRAIGMCGNAGHEKTKAILGVSWGTSCICHPLYPLGFCIQSSTSWHRCSKWNPLFYICFYFCSYIYLSSFFSIIFMVYLTFIWVLFGLDWKTPRRIKPSIMEHVAFSWKSPCTCNENWTYYWNHFPHCKFLFG